MCESRDLAAPKRFRVIEGRTGRTVRSLAPLSTPKGATRRKRKTPATMQPLQGLFFMGLLSVGAGADHAGRGQSSCTDQSGAGDLTDGDDARTLCRGPITRRTRSLSPGPRTEHAAASAAAAAAAAAATSSLRSYGRTDERTDGRRADGPRRGLPLRTCPRTAAYESLRTPTAPYGPLRTPTNPYEPLRTADCSAPAPPRARATARDDDAAGPSAAAGASSARARSQRSFRVRDAGRAAEMRDDGRRWDRAGPGPGRKAARGGTPRGGRACWERHTAQGTTQRSAAQTALPPDDTAFSSAARAAEPSGGGLVAVTVAVAVAVAEGARPAQRSACVPVSSRLVLLLGRAAARRRGG